MSAAGIICEYNPFHEGHKYHIQKARELTGADVVVAIMNGDFTQRGEPAIVDKYTRASMALDGGADLVFELPVRYGISSAEDFAYGGILALESLSFVDSYCFGSESGDVGALKRAGKLLAEENDEFRKSLAALLRSGLSYPAARERALREQMEGGEDGMPDLAAPNDILGIEYIKAADRLRSAMKPVVVKRMGMGYHDTEGQGFSSATAIRERIREGKFDGVSRTAEIQLKEAGYMLEAENFWNVCSYAIRNRWEDLERIKDVSEEIAGRFRRSWYQAVSLEDFVNRCKTKHVTTARIRRCVFQVLLGVEKCEEREISFPYIRLLGMRKGAAGYLKGISGTVLLGRLARDRTGLDEEAGVKLEQDIRASDLYRSVAMSVSGAILPDEYKHPVIVK